jgi:hypothetical protein
VDNSLRELPTLHTYSAPLVVSLQCVPLSRRPIPRAGIAFNSLASTSMSIGQTRHDRSSQQRIRRYLAQLSQQAVPPDEFYQMLLRRVVNSL